MAVFVLMITAFVLAVKYPDVVCLLDNAIPVSTTNDITTLHQLLNQESVMRAELQKQITSLQTIMLSLQAEMRTVKINCENGQHNLSTRITGVSHRIDEHENTQQDLSTRLNASQTLQKNISIRIGHYVNELQNLSNITVNMQAVQKNSAQQLALIDNKQQDISKKIAIAEAFQRNVSLRVNLFENTLSSFAKKHPPVAFLARLLHSMINVNTEKTIVYDDVVTNNGLAYDKITGVFTAPVSGIYEFSFSISSSVGSTRGYLVKNGENLLGTYSGLTHGGIWGLASSTVSLYLNKGNKLYVNEADSGTQTLHSGVMTYFTGHLVQQV